MVSVYSIVCPPFPLFPSYAASGGGMPVDGQENFFS